MTDIERVSSFYTESTLNPTSVTERVSAAYTETCINYAVWEKVSNFYTETTVILNPIQVVGNQIFPTVPGAGYPVKSSPTFDTQVNKHVSGFKTRMLQRPYPVWEFSLNFAGLASNSNWGGVGANSLQSIMGFFLDRRGAYEEFLFLHDTDNYVSNGQIGTGDGSTNIFTLSRLLGSSLLEPVGFVFPSDLSQITVAGVPLSPTAYQFISPNLVYLTTPPSSGQAVRATFKFYFRVTFSEDYETFEEFMDNLYATQEVKLTSVLPANSTGVLNVANIIDRESFGFSNNPVDYATYGQFAFMQTGGGGISYSATGGPYGGPTMAFDSYIFNPTMGVKLFPSSTTTTGTAAFHFQTPTLNSGLAVFTVFSGGFGFNSAVFTVGFTNDGYIKVYNGSPNNGTLVAQVGPAAYALNVFTFVEIGFLTGSSGGVTVKNASGGTLLSYSGALNGSGSSGAPLNSGDRWGIGNYGGASGSQSYFANLRMMDSIAYLGETTVIYRAPTANSSVTFTPNGLASNYQNVSVNPPNPSTDYNSATSTGLADSFTFANLPSSSFVLSVQEIVVKRIATQVLAGSHTDQCAIISGGTTGSGAVNTLQPSPYLNQRGDQFALDPHTSAQWTVAAANAIIAQYKVLS